MIDHRDLDAMAAALRGSGSVITDTMAGTERRVADLAAAEVAKGARRHTQTGRMARSVRTVVEGHGTAQRVRVTVGPAAHLIIPGTRPHVIRSKRALTLTHGGHVFALVRSVHHPGTRPDPFVARAVERTLPATGAELDRAADAILGAVVAKARR